MDVTNAVFSLENLSKDGQLPVTVKIVRGVHSSGGTSQVCKGDVLHVLEVDNIAKVTADFTDDITIANRIFKPGSFELSIPLNYEGKLNIINEIKSYQLVSQLFEDMPRFVRVKEKLIVPDGNTLVEIEEGSVFEVVCRKHGKQRGHRREVDTLKIRCETLGYDYEMDVPVNTRSVFRSDPDTALYTMKTAVERYPLPAVAVFEEDFLYNLFAEKFQRDIKIGFTAPETVRLVKTVTHETYVCHLLERNGQQPHDPSSDILVLNASSQEVKDIRARVLDPETAARPDYEIPLMKRATLEKALRRPELVQISNTEDDVYEDVFQDENIVKGIRPESHVGVKRSVQRTISLQERSSDPGEYVNIKKSASTSEVESKSDTAATRSNINWSISGLASKIIDKIREPYHQKQVNAITENEKTHAKSKGLIKSDGSIHASEMSTRKSEQLKIPQAAVSEARQINYRLYTQFPSQDTTKDIGIYAEINERDMDDGYGTIRKLDTDQDCIAAVAKPKPKPKRTQTQKTTPNSQKPPAGLDEGQDNDYNVPIVDDVKRYSTEGPRSAVGTTGVGKPPQSNTSKLAGQDTQDNNLKSDTATDVEFKNLTVDELCARLTICRLENLAATAKLHSLDGWFFSQMEKERLRDEPFSLTNLEMMKFLKVREGWVPKV